VPVGYKQHYDEFGKPIPYTYDTPSGERIGPDNDQIQYMGSTYKGDLVREEDLQPEYDPNDPIEKLLREQEEMWGD
jgi:hypothetical protein